MCGPGMRKVGLIKIKIINGFGTFDPGDFDPVTPNSMAFLCYPGLMCGPGMRKIGKVFSSY